MKVYFFSNQDKKKLLYQKFSEEIELLGVEILANKKAEERMAEKNIKLIQKADICIFDCSSPDLTSGFLIAKSLELNKPTIVLYPKEKPLSFLKGFPNEKLIIQKYTSLNEIEKAVKSSFQKAQKLRDRRFNFFITPDLLNYLEKESRRLGITKAMLIRQLILNHQKKSQ